MLHRELLPNDPNGMTMDEAWRVQRVRIAERYGVPPSEVEKWSWQDIYDTLEVMEADIEIASIRTRLRNNHTAG